MSHRSTLSALTILLAVGGLFAVLAHAQDTPPADAAANPPGTMNQAQWIDMMKAFGDKKAEQTLADAEATMKAVGGCIRCE